MTPRLKQVTHTLYKCKQRLVLALSRHEAERIPALPHVAVVSITAPEREFAKLAPFKQLLRVSFADVDHLSEFLTPRAKAKMPAAFTFLQAQQILDFVEALPPEILAVVVHCEGGYSRSCAVALALHEHFGFIAEHERLKKANPSVLTLLRQAATARHK